MHAYALARPHVRLSLKVLKANGDRGDWLYAPQSGGSAEDAAMKIVGKDCASQCELRTVHSNGFDIRAFLPRPKADGGKIASEGPFVSIDARPVSATRGTLKSLVSAFKERLRRANPNLRAVRNPFMCMNITCPPRSYDASIEPAKDDVLFEDSEAVSEAFVELLKAYYVNETSAEHLLDPASEADQSAGSSIANLQTSVRGSQDARTAQTSPVPQSKWRSTMYNADEDGLPPICDKENRPLEEAEADRERRLQGVSPWTIAKLHAPPRHRGQAQTHAQQRTLMSLPDGRGRGVDGSSSPSFQSPQRQSAAVQMPLTPLPSSSPSRAPHLSALDRELQSSIHRLTPRSSQGRQPNPLNCHSVEEDATNLPFLSPPSSEFPPSLSPIPHPFSGCDVQRKSGHPYTTQEYASTQQSRQENMFAPPLRSAREGQSSLASLSSSPLGHNTREAWLNSAAGAQHASHPSKRRKAGLGHASKFRPPLLNRNASSISRRKLPNGVQGEQPSPLRPPSRNRDIRSFTWANPAHRTSGASTDPSQSISTATDSTCPESSASSSAARFQPPLASSPPSGPDGLNAAARHPPPRRRASTRRRRQRSSPLPPASNLQTLSFTVRISIDALREAIPARLPDVKIALQGPMEKELFGAWAKKISKLADQKWGVGEDAIDRSNARDRLEEHICAALSKQNDHAEASDAEVVSEGISDAMYIN